MYTFQTIRIMFCLQTVQSTCVGHTVSIYQEWKILYSDTQWYLRLADG